jgi:glucose/arabinose dehydrogenase
MVAFGMQLMSQVRLPGTATVLLLLSLAACGGGSDNFDPPPPNEPPPAGPPTIGVEPVFTQLAFDEPLAMVQAPSDPTRWFVVERAGIVREFPNDPGVALNDVSTFADLSARVDSSPGEGGLLGMAFHPDFATNRQVFLSYTRSSGGLESVVSRFLVDESSGALDDTSEDILLTVAQVAGNHNGGHLAFDPDGLLYAGFGDGGSTSAQANGQDTTNILGSIVRIGVDGGAPYEIPQDNPFAGNTECPQGTGTADCPEIFAWGFRNPWRFNFDRQTGELWVGDVGENSWEEVNRVEISQNYGWSEREGAHCFDPPTNCSTDNVDPITEYGHNLGNSITGGYVYRGTDIPDLLGFYLFGDFVTGRIWAVAADSEQGVDPVELVDTSLQIPSFAESDDGEVYVLDFSAGTIHQIVAD